MARRSREQSERGGPIGMPAFLGDGAEAFGAIRGVHGQALVVNVENAGDFEVPFTAIDKVAGQRVVFRWDALPAAMQEAIRHAVDREDYPPAEDHLEERELDEQDELDARPEAYPPVEDRWL